MAWIVHYRVGADFKSADAPTKISALDLARALIREGADVLFLQGPSGETVGRQEIETHRPLHMRTSAIPGSGDRRAGRFRDPAGPARAP